jgi:hypothetical protein
MIRGMLPMLRLSRDLLLSFPQSSLRQAQRSCRSHPENCCSMPRGLACLGPLGILIQCSMHAISHHKCCALHLNCYTCHCTASAVRATAPLPQVAPDTYLTTQPFMDKIKETLDNQYGWGKK